MIVAGSRTFDDYDLLCQTLDALTAGFDKPSLTVLSGHAAGADRLGEQWCFKRGVRYEVHHADWNTHGKAAGPRRNQQMVDTATHAVFFWDGQSRGTADCITRCRQTGVKVKVIAYSLQEDGEWA